MRTRLTTRIAVGVSALLVAPVLATALPASAAPAGGAATAAAGSVSAAVSGARAAVLAGAAADAGPGRVPVTRAGAENALRRAQALFAGPARGERSGRPAAAGSLGGGLSGGLDATLVLRDLALSKRLLSRADRRTAEQILARPTDGADPQGVTAAYSGPSQVTCGSHVCVHWEATPGNPDAPPADPADTTQFLDSDGNGVPDQVDTTLATFEHVWAAIIGDPATGAPGMGYRAPLSDLSSANNGGSDSTGTKPEDAGKLDVYLADLGDQGIYGYCTTDDPNAGRSLRFSGYCAVDNDFSPSQFGGAPALNSLEVTAAHEFFHAVQFAYDGADDAWFMEGSATWMEDEVYDAVNDNRQYLKASALARPDVPTDAIWYGSWIFFRYLAEHFGHGGHGDPTVVRDIWTRAAADPGHPNLYSLQAINAVIRARGAAFSPVFAGFGIANRMPGRFYSEGRAWPTAPLNGRYTLKAGAPSTGRQSRVLDHLSNDSVLFRPATNLRGTWRLRVRVDLPPRWRGSVANVVVHKRNGGIVVRAIALNAKGNGRLLVPFSRRAIASVELDLTNASLRTDCGFNTDLSCGGVPRDDSLRFAFVAAAVR